MFDNDVLLRVSPEKYHSHIYDIVKLFYSGAVRRAPGPHNACGAGGGGLAARASAVRRAPEPVDLNEPGDTGGRGGSAAADVITASFTEGRCVLELRYGAGGGASAGFCEREGALGPGRGGIAYEAKMALYRMLKARALSAQSDDTGDGAGAGRDTDGDAGVGEDMSTGFSVGAGGLGGWRLPWGALVGVRPIKLYADLMRTGFSKGEAAAEMARAYDVPSETSDLCLRIVENQDAIIQSYDAKKDCILYIGIPFCVSKCAYCSFASDAHNKADKYAEQYIRALFAELRFIAGHMDGAGIRPRAVYVGGGTPTALGRRELSWLLNGIAELFSHNRPDEITVEAGRSDSIDAGKLDAIREGARGAGRLRLCINPQSMNGSTLALIGRGHSPNDVVEAFWLARRAGFDDINMDIIAGLPGEGLRDFAHTLDAISEMRPESFTAHTLCVKRSSRIHEFGWRYTCPDAGETAAMQDAALSRATLLGMQPYYLYRQKNTIGNLANTGFAARGHECAYNVHEMADSVDVFAAGAGAVSKFVNHETGSIERVFNVKNLLEYISRNDEMIDRKTDFLANRERVRFCDGG